ncbi:MAG: hypothetical protein EB127_22400 [Alphaproteobacteria bacterium]|nr:hypothetical protein [Alphaproteobacteria bacterium]
MPKPLPGVGYGINSTNKGFSLDIYPTQQEEGNIQPFLKLNPFDCFIEQVTEGESTSHRLKIVKGTVTYHWAVTDIGVTGSGSLVPYFYDITKANLYPTGTSHNGSDSDSQFINNNGYINLTSGEDYVVFIYMLGPFYEVENEYEFRVPQLCISKIGDYPEENISDVPNTANRGADIQAWLTIGESAQYIGFIYKNTFSLRANIARIKWSGGINGTFIIEQITNYPNMKFTPNIYGGSNTEPGFDSTSVDGIRNEIEGYTKDLNEDSIGYTTIEQGEL